MRKWKTNYLPGDRIPAADQANYFYASIILPVGKVPVKLYL